jgi:hypothetical protein
MIDVEALLEVLLIQKSNFEQEGGNAMSVQSFVAMMPQEMKILHTRPLFAFEADVAKPSILGMTPGHDRRVGVVTGGSFEGESIPAIQAITAMMWNALIHP